MAGHGVKSWYILPASRVLVRPQGVGKSVGGKLGHPVYRRIAISVMGKFSGQLNPQVLPSAEILPQDLDKLFQTKALLLKDDLIQGVEGIARIGQACRLDGGVIIEAATPGYILPLFHASFRKDRIHRCRPESTVYFFQPADHFYQIVNPVANLSPEGLQDVFKGLQCGGWRRGGAEAAWTLDPRLAVEPPALVQSQLQTQRQVEKCGIRRVVRATLTCHLHASDDSVIPGVGLGHARFLQCSYDGRVSEEGWAAGA